MLTNLYGLYHGRLVSSQPGPSPFLDSRHTPGPSPGVFRCVSSYVERTPRWQHRRVERIYFRYVRK